LTLSEKGGGGDVAIDEQIPARKLPIFIRWAFQIGLATVYLAIGFGAGFWAHWATANRTHQSEAIEHHGTVKWYNDSKRYGFIEQEDSSNIFVYYSDIQGNQTLKQGDSVEFEIEKGPKGPHAVNVRVIN